MDQPPVRDPHGNAARSTVVSFIKLVVILLDFWLGYMGPWRDAKRRGVVLLERGWYDQLVDPRRYRLNPRVGRLTLLLGRFVPRADCVVVASGSAEVIYERCREISRPEVARQLSAWHEVAPLAGRIVITCTTTGRDGHAPADIVVRVLAAVGAGRGPAASGSTGTGNMTESNAASHTA